MKRKCRCCIWLPTFTQLAFKQVTSAIRIYVLSINMYLHRVSLLFNKKFEVLELRKLYLCMKSSNAVSSNVPTYATHTIESP